MTVIWLEVAGTDAGALQEFFGGVFGWKLNADNPMNYGMADITDDVGVGVGPAPEQEPNGHAMFYVGVDDVEAALAKAEELGGKRIMGPMEVPEGPTIGHFADPEGHVVGVYKGM